MVPEKDEAYWARVWREGVSLKVLESLGSFATEPEPFEDKNVLYVTSIDPRGPSHGHRVRIIIENADGDGKGRQTAGEAAE